MSAGNDLLNFLAGTPISETNQHLIVSLQSLFSKQ
jgi:hypothetical protein